MDVATSAAPSGGEGGIIAVQSPADTGADLSISQAARVLSQARRRPEPAAAAPESQPEPSSAPAQAAAPEPAEHELPSHEDNGSPAQPVPAETQAGDPAEALPPIEPPRSWTKEHKDAFAALPRDIQERVSETERVREADFLRRQQDAAEERKAAAAEREQLQTHRQQYEAALPQLLQLVQQQGANEFADIQSMADVERLAREDFPRYAAWDAHQKKLAAVAQEMQVVQQRQEQEVGQRWAEFSQREDQAMEEKVPELRDPAQAPKLRESAVNLLRERGFTDDELGKLYNGKAGVSLRDHRIQLLVLDATRWRDAQAKAKAVSAQPTPPVQRPGAAQPRTAAADAEIQALKQKLDKSGSLRDAAALRAAQQRASVRRA